MSAGQGLRHPRPSGPAAARAAPPPRWAPRGARWGRREAMAAPGSGMRPPAAGGGEGKAGRAGQAGEPGPGVGAGAAGPARRALCGPEGRVAGLISRPFGPTGAVPDPRRAGLAAPRLAGPRAAPERPQSRAAPVGKGVPGAEPSSHQEFCRFAAENLKQTLNKGLAYGRTGSPEASDFASFATELRL